MAQNSTSVLDCAELSETDVYDAVVRIFHSIVQANFTIDCIIDVCDRLFLRERKNEVDRGRYQKSCCMFCRKLIVIET